MKKLSMLLLTLWLCASCALGETFVLSMVGDCTVGDDWRIRGVGSSMASRIEKEGLNWPFQNVAAMFAEDDLTLANCEGVLADGQLKSSKQIMALRGPAGFAECFRLGGVDVCNFANNHAKDFGAAGMEATVAALNGQGIEAFWDEHYFIREIKGVRIGIVGYTYPINKQKMERYRKSIQYLREEEGCTFVIASVHWGKEESLKINYDQKLFGTAFIDMGADLVYGTGSHTLQPIQYYNGHLIFYSTSNFCFGANKNPKDSDTAVFQVVFDINEDGTMTAAELTAIPYKMHDQQDYRPYPIRDEAGKQQVLSKLVFHRKSDPDSNLPESFETTGYADLRSWSAGGEK